MDIQGLKASCESRKKYMSDVSEDIRQVENILKESGLDEFSYMNFEWKVSNKQGAERLHYIVHDHNESGVGKSFVLMEAKFHIREKAHKELSELIEFLKIVNEEHILSTIK